MLFVKKYIRARKFLKKGLNRNFWAFLFFLFLSAGFWLFLTLDEEYEIEVSVPVKLINVPRNVVVTTPLPDEIGVKIRDHGGSLLAYKYAHTLGTITVDFNNYSKSSGHVVIPTSEVTKGLVATLRGGTRITGYTPDTLEYYYNFGSYKNVPVVFTGRITADSLYSVDNIELSQQTVRVYASKSILDTLRAVYTKPIYLQRLTANKTFSVGFNQIKGVKVMPQSIRVTAHVDQVTEKTVQVQVRWNNFPASKELKTFPGVVDVTFQVGTKRYKEITGDDFAIVINYDDVADNSTNKIRLKLRGLPDGVSYARIVPEEVEFLIEDTRED